METDRADAIAQAILQPALEAQEQLRRRREREAQRLMEQRRRALFGLVGFAIGAAVGYVVGGRISLFGLIGGFVGVLVSWLASRRAT